MKITISPESVLLVVLPLLERLFTTVSICLIMDIVVIIYKSDNTYVHPRVNTDTYPE